jgi:hypothetical protein
MENHEESNLSPPPPPSAHLSSYSASNFQVQLVLPPTVKGTVNALEPCSGMKVRKLVVVSSIAASCFDPNWPEGKLKDESCWTDKQLCKETEVRNTIPSM